MSQSFEIYAWAVSGGALALTPAPGAAGALAEDVAAISQWGAAYVVSLTEAEEMACLGMQTLPEALSLHGINWTHFPIVDFDVPSAEPSERWQAVETQLLGALNAGERVLVHCRGGCGRSGMVVLKLMIAAGEKPEAALARLRAARACAVETDAQMVWATGGHLRKA